MRAIVVGATGAVGRDLVEALCADPRYTEVRTFPRRELGLDDPMLRPDGVGNGRTEGGRVVVRALQALNAIGLFKSMAPISTEIVAQCMAEAGGEPFEGVRRINKQAIRRFAQSK